MKLRNLSLVNDQAGFVNGNFLTVHLVPGLTVRVTPEKPPKEFDAIERKRTGPNQISSLIILDRTVDPVSPLLSPTSYYGLLADELDLKWNSITLKPEDSDAKPKKVSLSPDEPINEELSDVHVKHAARIISQKLRTLKAAFDERHDKKTVAEYKGKILLSSQPQFSCYFQLTPMTAGVI